MSSILNIKPGVPLIRNSAKNTTQASPYYGVLKLSASLARSDLRPLFQALVCYLYGIPSVVLLYDANIRCRQPQKYPHSIHGFSHGQVFWQLSDEFVYKWWSYINWYLMTLTRTWRSLIIQNMRYMVEYSVLLSMKFYRPRKVCFCMISYDILLKLLTFLILSWQTIKVWTFSTQGISF